MSERISSLRVPPDDAHNRALVEAVHPPGWENPKPAGRYHLVVLGGGTAGLVSAVGAAGLGARVALIERHLLGGDCLNVGCVPSKGILRAARAWSTAARSERFGLRARDATDGDFAAVMERMRRLRAAIAPHDGAERLRNLGIDVFLGKGRFVRPDAIEVAGSTLRFRRAVIATGARPGIPPIAGLEACGYLTNETLFGLTELPRRMVVIGAGPIGCEMAQAFARFGSTVTVIDQAHRMLPRDDPDAAAIVEASLARDGVRYLSRSRIEEARRVDGVCAVTYERGGEIGTVACDAILVAAGRSANVDGLGLAEAAVAYTHSGIGVDDRMRTSNRRIYACGDVASQNKFTHAADAQARAVIQNALFFGRASVGRIVIPWCTYTSPEVAHVGLTAEAAARDGRRIDTITVSMADLDRAVLDGEEDGFLRVHVERGRDRIVGATLVAEHAGELIGELCLAMSAGVGLSKIAATVHPYPTQGEIVKKAADAWRRTKLTPTVRRMFAAYFRLLR